MNIARYGFVFGLMLMPFMALLLTIIARRLSSPIYRLRESPLKRLLLIHWN